MSNLTSKRIIEELIASIDIPDSSYELAEKRYKDLADWFGRPDARCSKFNPHLYPQGSFRLGTVVRPLDDDGEYDLDMGCRLCTGITKATHTQKHLKLLVGEDLEDYRVARNIKEKCEEKQRCWRLRYSNALSFHLDAVPSIPEGASQRLMLKEAMVKAGSADVLAESVTEHAGAITDNRHANYEVICGDWRISNSEGYALWFESRMELDTVLLEKWASAARAAKIDKIPSFKRKSPLQKCIQILKRHRDVMFKDNPDGKPISVIITTLAADAYQGEAEIDDAMNSILSGMGNLVREMRPRVPNPVNPREDFADKWYDPKYANLNLEQNLFGWIERAKADFLTICNMRQPDLIIEKARELFAANLNGDDLRNRLGLGAAAINIVPKKHVISEPPAKPWSV